MANQTIHIGCPLSAPLTMDIFPLLGGAAINGGVPLDLVVDLNNPEHFKVTRVGTNAGWFVARLYEGGGGSFNSPWFGRLLNQTGDYWFSLQPPKQWELGGVTLYHADIQFTRDEENEQDEYTVTWMKDGVQVTVFDTEPTVKVTKRVDGTDLVAEVNMLEIGSTGHYKYDEADDRVTLGELVVVTTEAGIDGLLHRFTRLLGRDS